MQGPQGFGRPVPGNYGWRAAPNAAPARPLPVPLGTGTGSVSRPLTGVPSTSVIGSTRPVPVTGLQVPSTSGGLTVQRPSVLLPSTAPSSSTGVVSGGRPLLDRPVTQQQQTLPQATYPQRTIPQVVMPQSAQSNTPQTLMPRTNPSGTCAITTNTGLIGLFDRTIGAAVKALLGMTDGACSNLPNNLSGNLSPRSIR